MTSSTDKKVKKTKKVKTKTKVAVAPVEEAVEADAPVEEVVAPVEVEAVEADAPVEEAVESPVEEAVEVVAPVKAAPKKEKLAAADYDTIKESLNGVIDDLQTILDCDRKTTTADHVKVIMRLVRAAQRDTKSTRASLERFRKSSRRRVRRPVDPSKPKVLSGIVKPYPVSDGVAAFFDVSGELSRVQVQALVSRYAKAKKLQDGSKITLDEGLCNLLTKPNDDGSLGAFVVGEEIASNKIGRYISTHFPETQAAKKLRLVREASE